MCYKKIGWLAVLLLLCACQPEPVATAVNITPEIWQIYMTSTLDWMRPHMNTCMQNHPEADLLVLESSPEFFERDSDAFQLRWGVPDMLSGYSAILGEEDLVIIVHPENPLTELTTDQLRSIYTGKITHWEELSDDFEGNIAAWSFPSKEDIQKVFEKAIDTSQLSAQVYIAPDSRAMLQSVAASSNAIGFITGHWYYKSVQRVMVLDLDDPIRINPILAIAREEPQGARLEWLLCLQASIQPELHY